MTVPPKEFMTDKRDSYAGEKVYARRTRCKGLQAADAALRLWVIRVPCGAFALLQIGGVIHEWLVAPNVDLQLVELTFYMTLFAVELGNIGFRGRSLWTRFLLSGYSIVPDVDEEQSKCQ